MVTLGARSLGHAASAAPRRELRGLSTGLLGFVLANSWRHQLTLILLTISVFLLEVAPLELQRRIINDIVKHRPYTAIVTLALGYLAAVALQGGTKLVVNIYRAWIGERIKRDLRTRIHATASPAFHSPSRPADPGISVALTVAEVEPVGNFVGSSLSEPLLQGGILATVIAYVAHIDRWMGAAALLLFLPQLIFVPLIQWAMNKQSAKRTWLLRRLAQGIVTQDRDGDTAGAVERVFGVAMRLFELKFAMNFLMNLCSHLQIILALLLGGWWVLHGALEIGGVVAFLSALNRVNDPWGDLVNYFREYSNTRVKFDLLVAALRPSVSSLQPIIARTMD